MTEAAAVMAVLRKTEAMLSRWERGIDPHSEVALLLADLRSVLERAGEPA